MHIDGAHTAYSGGWCPRRASLLFMLVLPLWLLLSWISCSVGDSLSSVSLLSAYEDAFIAQRDTSAIIPVDQLTSFGISLNRVIFDSVGYSNASLSYLTTFLNLKTGMFMLDLYWNDLSRKWQLCPAPFPLNQTLDLSQPVRIPWKGKTYTCQPSFSVNEFLRTFEDYLSRTNVRLEANVIQLAFNLKSITAARSNSTSYNATSVVKASGAETQHMEALLAVGNATLQDSLSPLMDYLFKPSDCKLVGSTLTHDTSQQFYYSSFPTQYELIYTLYKRVLPFVLSNELSDASSYRVSSQDYDLMFFPDHSDFSPYVENLTNDTLAQEIDNIYDHSTSSHTFGQIVNLSQFRLLIDSDEASFNNESITKYLKSGFTTVLNSSHYELHDTDDADTYANDDSETSTTNDSAVLYVLSDYIPISYWSWAPLEPVSFIQNDTQTGMSHNESWYTPSATQSAYQCVSIGKTGWALLNCYDKMRWACKNNSNPFSWEISDDTSTFFQINDAECPPGFTVGVPRLSIEQFSLVSLLRSRNVNAPIWIDLNDITVSGCFVSGGPYALCPYKEVITTRSFIKSLAPSSLVALFLLFLILCHKCSTVPIHSNRKRHWRKTITNYYKENDYEGVPL